MGSWTDLDATYPPGRLTPAAAFVVAVARLRGMRSVFVAPGQLVPELRRIPLPYDADLLERAERFLTIPLGAYLAEAAAVLRPAQRDALAAFLFAEAMEATPAQRGLLAELLAHLGAGASAPALAPGSEVDLAIFPQ
jgi:hypothetical protein